MFRILKILKIKRIYIYIFIGEQFQVLTGNFISKQRIKYCCCWIVLPSLHTVRKIPSKFGNRILARPWIGDVQISNYTFVCSGPEFPHPGRRYLCRNSSPKLRPNCARHLRCFRWNYTAKNSPRYKLQCIHRWKWFDIFLSNIRFVHGPITRLIFNYRII